jgi:hypothetical protein
MSNPIDNHIPPGFCEPPPGYKGKLKWQPWGTWKVAVGIGWGAHVLNEIAERRNNNQANIIAIYGPPGEGKTYFALALAEILDPKFDVQKQVLFTREAIMSVIDGTTDVAPGQCLIIDESQFSMAARTFANTGQIDVMNHLVALRSRNFIVFIIVLDPSMLDKIARQFTLSMKIFMLRRGHGRVYRFKQGPLSKDPYPETVSKDFSLDLPGSGGLNGCTKACLTCPASGLVKGRWRRRDKWAAEGFIPCLHQRSIYERMKRSFLEEHAAADTAKNRPTAKKTASEIDEILDKIYKTLPLNYQGYPDMAFINDAFAVEGVKLSQIEGRSARARLMKRHGEDIKSRHLTEKLSKNVKAAKK